ncbi:MAG TPA: flagellar type III secretion system pore protein FliP [Polyangiaceae bacterium]|jgi:flagellar biosynthetic protein FliP|nr:flagellar type III secretion system pore protein FliP [Polyangiaceae bacterium]
MNPATTLASLTQEGGGMTQPVKILILLTLLSLLPAIALTMTSFVRTIVVLSFLRQGIGAQQSPPSQVLVGLSIFVTAFVMSPVALQMKQNAIDPYSKGTITEAQAFDAAVTPIRAFMLRQTRQQDLQLFYNASHAELPKTPEDVSIAIALPSFVVSELTTSFQMGVMVLLPFLVIDLAVASLLMSMGMMMVSPSTLSLPIKLLLFVLADGWNLVIGSLLSSFR